MLRPLPNCGWLLGQPQDLDDLSALNPSWRSLNIFSLAQIFPRASPMVALKVNVSGIPAYPFIIWFVRKTNDLVHRRDF